MILFNPFHTMCPSKHAHNLVVLVFVVVGTTSTQNRITLHKLIHVTSLVCHCYFHIIRSCGLVWWIYPYSPGLLHWHWGNRMIAPMPVKQSRTICTKSTDPDFYKPQQNTPKHKHVHNFLGIDAFLHLTHFVYDSGQRHCPMWSVCVKVYSVGAWFQNPMNPRSAIS